ncbi:MAG: hypothetical protein HOV80_19115 [Polyangiaceae bacterium]|nr:hypothetical protein [Polyangiaceae bacterium]
MSPARTHAYPADLVRFASHRWPAGATTDDALLTEVVAVAYHASFLRDEDRPVLFRLIFTGPGKMPANDTSTEGLHVLKFASPRPFDEQEIRRLSQGAPYDRALIGVCKHEDTLVIWGIVHTGTRWLQSASGARAPDHALPDCVVLRVARPGHVALSWGEAPVAELRQGDLGDSRVDVFASDWLPARFADVRAEIADIVARDAKLAESVDLEVIRLIGQQLIRRTIAMIRAAHHGGTLLVVPPECATSMVDERFVRLKYPFADKPARSRYRQLLMPMLREIAPLSLPGQKAGPSEYFRALSTSARTSDDAMFELAQFIASLAAVDGAVVLSKRFEIMGFGGEIAGDLTTVPVVRRSLDLEGTRFEEEVVDRVGTRHRSAYRLCNRFHTALAVVVSQDGSVRFITWHQGAVTYWDHASLGLSESA